MNPVKAIINDNGHERYENPGYIVLRINDGSANPCNRVVTFAICLACGTGFLAKNAIKANGADIISRLIINSN